MLVRIFLAGASGVIGRRLVPLLVDAGHEVAGMARSAAKADLLTELGAVPVVCDVFDLERLTDEVAGFGPEMVMHQLTDLPDDVQQVREFGAANARIRRHGTRNLCAAAGASGAQRFLAQSVAWELPGDGGSAVAEMERMVLDIGGVVVRYGQFYGPGTYHEARLPPQPRIAVDEAARRTLELLTSSSGIVTVVDPA
jgi:nucleoside-diphosphate-sugar epimerase